MRDLGRQQKEFLQVIDSCRGTILKVCLTYTDRTREDIEDLYQDIVYNLWDYYPFFRHESSASTWVYRVAVNTARQYLRRRSRRPFEVVLDESVFAALAEPEADPRIERFYTLIDLLGEDEKELLFLYLDGMPQKDMAQMYHISEEAMAQRIYRIKNKLKRLNKDEPE